MGNRGIFGKSLLSGLAGLLAIGSLGAGGQGSPRNWALGPFTRPVEGPILRPRPESLFVDPLHSGPVHWEALHTFNPAAIVRNGKVYVLYRAEDDSGAMQIGMHTSRLGLAQSSDGIHFTRLPQPVFFAAKDAQLAREWPGGVEDPRIVESPDGTYVLTYTQWNRTTYSIGVATSRDLLHWTKFGPALGETGAYGHLMYKSGSVVTRLEHGRLIAAKIHGKFWMYWGEIQVRLAFSEDLIHWKPEESAPGIPRIVLEKRPGKFDSGFPEVGPPAILTRQGIVLIYNGKNAEVGNDPDTDFAPGAYAAGQALFSAEFLTELRDRLDQPSLFPEKDYERSGQYAAGTTFAEGLVYFRQHWLLYYGCADSFVAVATAPAPRRL